MIKEFLFALSLIRKSFAGDYRVMLGFLNETWQGFKAVLKEIFVAKHIIPWLLMVIAFTPLAAWIVLIVIRLASIPQTTQQVGLLTTQVPDIVVDIPSILAWSAFLGASLAFAKVVGQAEAAYDRTNHEPYSDWQNDSDRMGILLLRSRDYYGNSRVYCLFNGVLPGCYW